MTVNPFYHHTNQRLEEELSWIRRAQKDPESFGPLYKKYHEQIFRYIYQRMDDEEKNKQSMKISKVNYIKPFETGKLKEL